MKLAHCNYPLHQFLASSDKSKKHKKLTYRTHYDIIIGTIGLVIVFLIDFYTYYTPVQTLGRITSKTNELHQGVEIPPPLPSLLETKRPGFIGLTFCKETAFSQTSSAELRNATDKANNAKDQTVASIYDNRFCIPLDFEILESSLPLYQYGLGSCLTYELTFADYSDVIKATDPDATYTISNISLEFDTIINASLPSQIRTEYMKSSILCDRILRARIIPLKNSDTSFSIDINSPSKSLKGVLLIFTKELRKCLFK